jgi:hypothetical protein
MESKKYNYQKINIKKWIKGGLKKSIYNKQN